ncbi:hypothetical protein E2C01_058669 [Portunus trituberculatus]|uniref:Uncharacterized protein n=1 Tax=Portunus trituberculatus TaxID=210409 RepID=A0A5B7GW67_PORTR|nr:hypothetical protein [Portunus trituberculatus]
MWTQTYLLYLSSPAINMSNLVKLSNDSLITYNLITESIPFFYHSLCLGEVSEEMGSSGVSGKQVMVPSLGFTDGAVFDAEAEPLRRVVHVERRRIHGSRHQALIVLHNGLAIAPRHTVRLGRLG